MRRRLLAGFVVCGMGLVLAGAPASAADGGRKFAVAMTGAEEAPDPGDPDGSGTASFRFNPGRETVCYTLTVEDVDDVTAAHIHKAPAGVAGAVVIGLAPPTTGTSSACATVDRGLAIDIFRNPADYYVNVHSADFPGGAVRGQLA